MDLWVLKESNALNMQNEYSTARLLLEELTLHDAEFVMELVNTVEWIKYIGNRNINTTEEARGYIQKIIDNPAINYWIVNIRDQKKPVGVISFIKRDYLTHHDIGFAFLNQHKKRGYAFEAASVVIDDALQNFGHTQILATTIRSNSKSIQLLQKLGFNFYKEIVHEQEPFFIFVRSRAI